MGAMRNTYKITVRKPKGRDCLECLSIGLRIILKLTLKEQDGKI
jgi:hypothetical protein